MIKIKNKRATKIQIAATAKEQGDLFVEPVCKMSRKSPEYPEIERVDFWKDWTCNENIVDIGIDLVVETRGGEFRAVQCKFYDSASTIPREEIDSFLSAAEPPRLNEARIKLPINVDYRMKQRLTNDFTDADPRLAEARLTVAADGCL